MPTGEAIGPSGVLLHTPGLVFPFVTFSKNLAALPGISPRCREVIIILVSTLMETPVEVHLHKIQASTLGFTPDELNTIERAECPASLKEDEKVCFEVAKEMTLKIGTLKLELWDKAVEVLSKPGAAALVQNIAFYKYVSTFMNGFAGELPPKTLQGWNR
ncbi:hypothetical protein LTR84_002695 [Exophiala bonariae]|uniref:Carboxymuconolactone decarboxylase-like domain-containing protein n=1 Tax=Exophiala bonariae TaxID=1690606 RepID=A0AAV9NC80_9EURO|nr:hypothetical protein LTR84_002695 [Exophiala bonariae]